MYLCILNIERAKNFVENFFFSCFNSRSNVSAKKLLSSIDLYYMGPAALQRNKFMQFIYMKIPPKVLCVLNVQDA